jgi:hypothetical protein
MISALLITLATTNAQPPPPPTEAAAEPAPEAGGEVGPQLGGGEAPPPDDGGGGGNDVTYYQFSGLGIDGELRTPALLQFLSRIGGEFETVGIPHRSFMPELQQTVMEDAL